MPLPIEFTYEGDPSKDDLAAVRFMVGDTDCRRPLLDDREILYALTETGSKIGAAIMVLDQLATRFAREADFSAGDVSKSFSQIADAYQKRSESMRQNRYREALPFFGGQSINGKRALDSNTDAVAPHARFGMTDNPDALQFDGVYDRLYKLGWWR